MIAAMGQRREAGVFTRGLMGRLSLGLLAFTAVVGLASHVAAKSPDCPLAHAPYSSSTVFIDLLLNPETKAVLERDAPDLMRSLPAPLLQTTTPTFAAIFTPRQAASLMSAKSADFDRLDRDLAAVVATPQSIAQRCARYDTERPTLAKPTGHPAILVFDKITGFRDAPSVDAASAALKAMAAEHHWSLVFTDNGAAFNDRDLKAFDAVVWNNISGDALTLPQEAALKRFVEGGKGFAAFHGSGGDPAYLWDWYADHLIGARFKGHPMNPQFQAAKVVIDDPTDPIVQGLGDWTMTEEWYSFLASPRLKGAHILARLDESTYSPIMGQTDLHMGDHPIAWTQCLGRGRSFYTAIGHRPESYTEPHSRALMERGIAWAAGGPGPRCPPAIASTMGQRSLAGSHSN